MTMTTFASPIGTTSNACPRLERTDIHFHNTSFERVQIELEVHNRSDLTTDATTARIESALFGAFLPWRPLATVEVPSIEPHATGRVTLTARRPAVVPRASFADLPPGLIAAIAAGAGDAEPGADTRTTVRNIRLKRGFLQADPVRAGFAMAMPLAPDLFELMGSANTHWVGNLNVFLGERPVERHAAKALRVYAGRTNVAMFCLGRGRDAYRFDLAGEATAWNVRLQDMRAGRASVDGGSLRIGAWHEIAGTSLVSVALQPPPDAERGSLEVHVQERSSGQEAVVEFDLDPTAAGPGCFRI